MIMAIVYVRKLVLFFNYGQIQILIIKVVIFYNSTYLRETFYLNLVLEHLILKIVHQSHLNFNETCINVYIFICM